MLRYVLFILLLASCSSSTQLVAVNTIHEQQTKLDLFDELNQYEHLIEETKLTTTKVKDLEVSTATQYALQAGSWLLVQYVALSQKVTAWCAVLVNGSEDNDNE